MWHNCQPVRDLMRRIAAFGAFFFCSFSASFFSLISKSNPTSKASDSNVKAQVLEGGFAKSCQSPRERVCCCKEKVEEGFLLRKKTKALTRPYNQTQVSPFDNLTNI